MATPEFFHSYEIYSKDEMDLMVRLFKRFYYRTIEKRYGYLKPCQDRVEISGKMLSFEMELNPRVLVLCGLITSFNEDVMIDWISFIKILSIFLLNKPLLHQRFMILLKFLKIKKDLNVLNQADYF